MIRRFRLWRYRRAVQRVSKLAGQRETVVVEHLPTADGRTFRITTTVPEHVFEVLTIGARESKMSTPTFFGHTVMAMVVGLDRARTDTANSLPA